ncbi:hypothetical protein NL108_002809 [Boleophthalmus pectinirostris]|nr:hypothetical protein NL108_002809 [Boleophthalmus pectinirostris]
MNNPITVRRFEIPQGATVYYHGRIKDLTLQLHPDTLFEHLTNDNTRCSMIFLTHHPDIWIKTLRDFYPEFNQQPGGRNTEMIRLGNQVGNIRLFPKSGKFLILRDSNFDVFIRDFQTLRANVENIRLIRGTLQEIPDPALQKQRDNVTKNAQKAANARQKRRKKHTIKRRNGRRNRKNRRRKRR